MKSVRVQNGLVEGQTKTILGKPYVEFLCIPYCKPPTNELRFKRPEKIINFSNNVINKSHFDTCPPQLFQRIDDGTNQGEEQWIPKETQSEDCLYLNIWCPLDAFISKDRIPVFVWIHGGGFMTGSSSLPLYNGSILSSQENVIVVSINYRLGIFGFLCLDDELANGNQGLHDQILALEWIHENISVFNGDSENITIAGNSAGGSSVSLHLLMEKSWKYFNRAIMQSGVCLSDWSLLPKEEICRRSEIIINQLLDKTNYPIKWNTNLSSNKKANIFKHLQTISFEDILKDSEIFSGIYQCAWTPFIDKELISDNPRILFNSGKYKNCPMIFLNSKNEGNLFIFFEYPNLNVEGTNLIDQSIFHGLFKYYPYYPIECKEIIKEKIKEEYNITNKIISIEILDKIISDQHIQCDIIELGNIISKFNKNIFYLSFETKSSKNYWPEWCGVIHTDEIYYLFGHPLIEDLDSNKYDSEASIVFMKQFGYFMRNGIMNKDLPSYNEKSRNYISIRGNDWNIETFTEDKFQKVKFWSNLRKQFD